MSSGTVSRCAVAGGECDVYDYSGIPDPDADGEVVVAALERVFKKNVLRCPMDDCNGE